MSEITWAGRIYVDEKKITPQEYKEFFERGEFVISFKVANTILRNREEGNFDECVPADQLIQEARNDIKRQVMGNYETEGVIELEGQTLNWKWEPEITRDREEISIEDLEDYELEKILTDMLDNECHWGMW